MVLLDRLEVLTGEAQNGRGTRSATCSEPGHAANHGSKDEGMARLTPGLQPKIHPGPAT